MLNKNILQEIRPEYIDQIIAWLEQDPFVRHVIGLHDVAYPRLLKDIIAPPKLLFVRGNVMLLDTIQIAMVGSRRPSYSGADTAFSFAKELSQAGLTITSGLATGIDGQSHLGALAGSGKTVAVLGTGIDMLYPKCHGKLIEDIIAKDGAVVSQFHLSTAAKAHNFPQRNRILSGLACGTLVIEAGIKSGSLITAHCAAEQGRDVFVVPGSIHNLLMRGSHQLIKDGAKLVDSVTDILEEYMIWGHRYGFGVTTYMAPNKSSADVLHAKQQVAREHEKLLQCIDYHVTTVDTIVARSSLSITQVLALLTVLEACGLIKRELLGYIKNS